MSSAREKHETSALLDTDVQLLPVQVQAQPSNHAGALPYGQDAKAYANIWRR